VDKVSVLLSEICPFLVYPIQNHPGNSGIGKPAFAYRFHLFQHLAIAGDGFGHRRSSVHIFGHLNLQTSSHLTKFSKIVKIMCFTIFGVSKIKKCIVLIDINNDSAITVKPAKINV